ncbi:MAG: BtaA family protein [Saprospiraceae bacterium]|nr:BtaA family protein [Saprospiraceae bacterium]
MVEKTKQTARQQLNQHIFQKVHSNNLIYNTCWEDPHCDRELLQLDTSSKVVMITSAGCNALDYALDKPAEIHCVDMNPRQNALLELKKSIFEKGDSENLTKMFGTGVHTQVDDFYQSALRPVLPDYAQAYWDKNIDFFVGKGIRKSFYWHSTSGLFAWSFSQFMKFQKKNYKLAKRLFEAESLEEQRELYFELEKKLLNNFVKWALKQQITMTLLGVPQSQKQFLGTDTEGGNFFEKCLRQVFTQLPISDNYFWQLYFKGQYTTDCQPNYLKQGNFETLKNQMPTIQAHNATITSFLAQNPSQYTHFVLLDHQDWLAENNCLALAEEWRAILQNSRKGTRILLRSAAQEITFFPDFVHEKVVFDIEKTTYWHKQDRVGTYGSVYLGIVQN